MPRSRETPRGGRGRFFHTYSVLGAPIQDSEMLEEIESNKSIEESRRHHSLEDSTPHSPRRLPEGIEHALDDGSSENETESPEPGLEGDSKRHQPQLKAGRVRCNACGTYVIASDPPYCSMCGRLIEGVDPAAIARAATIQQESLNVKRTRAQLHLPRKGTSPRGDINLAQCNYCHELIVPPNAKFCSNCGASLHDELETRSLIRKGKEAKARKRTGTKAAGLGTCTVCNLVVSQQDNLTWCPHCGNPAHRDHLLEWIRRRNRCPVCGEHLDERELHG